MISLKKMHSGQKWHLSRDFSSFSLDEEIWDWNSQTMRLPMWMNPLISCWRSTCYRSGKMLANLRMIGIDWYFSTATETINHSIINLIKTVDTITETFWGYNSFNIRIQYMKPWLPRFKALEGGASDVAQEAQQVAETLRQWLRVLTRTPQNTEDQVQDRNAALRLGWGVGWDTLYPLVN